MDGFPSSCSGFPGNGHLDNDERQHIQIALPVAHGPCCLTIRLQNLELVKHPRVCSLTLRSS
ncbi:MAG: hypothetical protein CSYNP_04171 [Syntrophus sp. SKADARSKE-3]|nr:hypothetical protein [Syntrophus sp. SKADARSKE-3]